MSIVPYRCAACGVDITTPLEHQLNHRLHNIETVSTYRIEKLEKQLAAAVPPPVPAERLAQLMTECADRLDIRAAEMYAQSRDVIGAEAAHRLIGKCEGFSQAAKELRAVLGAAAPPAPGGDR